MRDEFIKALDEVVSRAYAGESGLKLDEARARLIALHEAEVKAAREDKHTGVRYLDAKGNFR